MNPIGPLQHAPRVLPNLAPQPCGIPSGAAVADFASLIRSTGLGLPPVGPTAALVPAERLPQTHSPRPEVEAALVQFHMVQRVPPSVSRTGRPPHGSLVNAPAQADGNSAERGLLEDIEERAGTCTQATKADLCDAQREDPLAWRDRPCGHGLIDGVVAPCVPAVPAPPAVLPPVWTAWPLDPSFLYPLQARRVRVWRRRFFYPHVDEFANDSDGEDDRAQARA